MDYFSISIGAAANVFSLTPLTRQSNAKQQYLLTDRDLSKLGSISKENPRHKDWQPMKLFLESQVVQLSTSHWSDGVGAGGVGAGCGPELFMMAHTISLLSYDSSQLVPSPAHQLQGDTARPALGDVAELQETGTQIHTAGAAEGSLACVGTKLSEVRD